MQIVCYLIICPDIVNTIRLCWSLVAERKEQLSFLGQRLQEFGGEVLRDGSEEEELKSSSSLLG